MSESVGFIVTMCASVSLCSFAAYTKGDARAVRLALGVILLSSLISPISEIVCSVDFKQDQLPNIGYEGQQLREDEIEQALCTGIKNLLKDELLLDGDLISVELSGLNTEDMTCKTCTVRLWGRAVLTDFRRVEELVMSCGVNECEVILSI